MTKRARCIPLPPSPKYVEMANANKRRNCRSQNAGGSGPGSFLCWILVCVVFVFLGLLYNYYCTPEEPVEVSLGGKILSTRDTVFPKLKQVPGKFMGIDVLDPVRNLPNYILEDKADCWAFLGVGKVVIGLGTRAVITGFTLEHHSPKENSPCKIGNAPNHFEVYGLKDYSNSQKSAWKFGDYSYNKTGPGTQVFHVKNPTKTVYDQVEFKILDNHGCASTCLYRVKVLGRGRSNYNPPLLKTEFV